MTGWTKALSAKSNDMNLTAGTHGWKEKTDAHELSSDFHMHTMV